ncbi:MAG: hypothetical protein H7832_15175 [Magnetococcus sp. DMHC-6]
MELVTSPESMHDRIEYLQEIIKAMRHVLHQVPHSRGDHTDLCRFHNQGQPPLDSSHCHCHVAQVVRILTLYGLQP